MSDKTFKSEISAMDFQLFSNLVLQKTNYINKSIFFTQGISSNYLKQPIIVCLGVPIIIDSSTISLFEDILSWIVRKPITVKRKGCIKVHIQIRLQYKVPKLIWFSDETTHDKQFLKHLQLEKGKIALFDKGYNDYKTFDEFSQNGWNIHSY